MNFSKRSWMYRGEKMATPVVAIVGRPNVGKSTLFNKLIGQRAAIVDDKPGVTRDRIYGECEWLNRKIFLIDTGGIEPKSDDIILKQMRYQAQLAIDSADVIIFVTDIRSGVLSADMEVASMLQKSGKAVVLCVNKRDNIGAPTADFYEFYNLGLGEPIAISSVHGHGSGDLLDEVFKHLPKQDEIEDNNAALKVAIIGKPNVGKSSLVNRVLGEERCIVSDIAGTTRDAVDTPFENKHGKFIFIDTAGLRRSNKVFEDVERYSVIRANMAIQRCDVCVIMIDASCGFTEQDAKIAGMAHEAGKACVIAVNKWDVIEKDSKTSAKFKQDLNTYLSFMTYASVVFISVKTGQRINNLFDSINAAAKSSKLRISTATLNDLLAQAVIRNQPPTDKGKRLKIYYMTQVAVQPPTFVCFVNSKKLFHFSYKRYLENRIREDFILEGTPIKILVREKDEKKLQ